MVMHKSILDIRVLGPTCRLALPFVLLQVNPG
jgi:hypothetical protein